MEFGHFLTDKLIQVSAELNDLSQYSEDFYRYHQANTFDNHLILTENLDNLIQSATNELADILAFQTQKIKLMLNFMEFRQRFTEFNSDELEQIIDNLELSATEKLKLAKKLDIDTKDLLDKIRLVKLHWFANFEQSYQTVNDKLIKS